MGSDNPGGAGSSPYLTCLDCRLPTQYHALYASLNGHAIEWCPSAPGLKTIVAQSVLGLGVYLNPGIGLGRQAKNAKWCIVRQLDQPIQRETALRDCRQH